LCWDTLQAPFHSCLATSLSDLKVASEPITGHNNPGTGERRPSSTCSTGTMCCGSLCSREIWGQDVFCHLQDMEIVHGELNISRPVI
ncbi:hypothetical protein SK128_005211, partial [Halocaridina rubra]